MSTETIYPSIDKDGKGMNVMPGLSLWVWTWEEGDDKSLCDAVVVDTAGNTPHIPIKDIPVVVKFLENLYGKYKCKHPSIFVQEYSRDHFYCSACKKELTLGYVEK